MPNSIKYTLSFPQRRQHLLEIRLDLQLENSTDFIDLNLPVWSPGSYVVRDYSRHLRNVTAQTKTGTSINVEQVEKARYRVETSGVQELTVCYQVYCNELTVRTSELNDAHAFLHGPTHFFAVDGVEFDKYQVELDLPSDWKSVSTGLTEINKNKLYEAASYDDLLDCPLEIGSHEIASFMVQGKPHYLACYGPLLPHKKKVLADIERIINHVADYVGEIPYDNYTIISHFLPKIFGGLEHKNSTAVQFCSLNFGSKEGYEQWLGLIAHEYFHTWNIKRIRPNHLDTFDYSKENFTDMLWLAEGLTSFVDDQFVYRMGFHTLEEYLQVIKNNLNCYESIPGRYQHSLEESSFNAWIKLYRPDENSNNSSVSYYLKGGLVFGLLNIMLHQAGSSTQAFVRALWQHYNGQPEKGISKQEVLDLITQLSNQQVSDTFAEMLVSKDDIAFEAYYKTVGLEFEREKAKALSFGIQTEFKENRIYIKAVSEGNVASDHGLYAADEIIAINGIRLLKDDWAKRNKWLQENEAYTFTISRQNILKNIVVSPIVVAPEIKKICIVDQALAEACFKGC